MNVRKFKVAKQNYLKLRQKLHLNQSDRKVGFTEPVLELFAVNDKIKCAFSRLYCCNSKVLFHENENVFNNDWAL